MHVKCLVTFIALIFEVVSMIPWDRGRWAWNVQTSSFSVYFLNWNGSESCVSKFPMSAEAWAFQPIQFGGYYPNPTALCLQGSLPLAVSFTHGGVCLSALFSQFSSPSPSPAVSAVCCLCVCLYSCPSNSFISTSYFLIGFCSIFTVTQNHVNVWKWKRSRSVVSDSVRPHGL